MPKLLDVKHCAGCRNDFYNGKNGLGVKECWNRKDAEFGKFMLIPLDLRPPYLNVPIEKLPVCYQRDRYVKVKPEALDGKGFWK